MFKCYDIHAIYNHIYYTHMIMFVYGCQCFISMYILFNFYSRLYGDVHAKVHVHTYVYRIHITYVHPHLHLHLYIYIPLSTPTIRSHIHIGTYNIPIHIRTHAHAYTHTSYEQAYVQIQMQIHIHTHYTYAPEILKRWDWNIPTNKNTPKTGIRVAFYGIVVL